MGQGREEGTGIIEMREVGKETGKFA